MMLPVTAVRAMVLLVALTVSVSSPRSASGEPAPNTTGTRLAGIRPGPHAVGFEVRNGVDRSRRINRSDEGTRIGLAVWYPARAGATGQPAMSSMDYRLLASRKPMTAPEAKAYEEQETNVLVSWRHAGIVALSAEQASASLRTRGIAVSHAPALRGRFPVVMLMGGQYYLSTTAEILASHGCLVVAPFRFADQSNEIGTGDFSWYLENSVRDAEWALNEVRGFANADAGDVSTIGHGGGGLQAMLFAMRNRNVAKAVNIDAANFSTRSRLRELTFYSPRLMRASYLFVVTADTKKGLDLFDDFQQMHFSDRVEITLASPELRHHDLSDIGRAVTAPMGIRGEPQAEVEQAFADVQDMVVRFLAPRSAPSSAQGRAFPEWLKTLPAARYSVAVRPGIEPAPTIVRVLETLDRNTPATLRLARQRDPQAPLFDSGNLIRIVETAIGRKDFTTALAVADFALELSPGSPLLQAYQSRVLEESGNRADALQSAAACAAKTAGNDWEVAAAIAQCKERVARLTANGNGRE